MACKPGMWRICQALAAAAALVLVLLAPAGASAGPAPWLAQSDLEPDATPSTDTVSTAPAGLDPCQLVTSAEASSLAGTTFGKGLEENNEGGSWTCVYGYQTLNVFMVTVAQAPDADTAQADWADYQAQAQALMERSLPPGVSGNLTANDVQDVPGADRAALAQGGITIVGRTINVSAIYFLKGATFVTFSDLVVGQPAPTAGAMETEAQTVLGRLP